MRQPIRHTKERAHPDNGTDPFNGPDADDIWWGFIEGADEFDWATCAPTGAARKPRRHI